MAIKGKIIRTSTVPESLNDFCIGLLKELKDDGYEVVGVSSPGPELDALAAREGVRTVAVPMERHISPWRDLCSLIRLIRVFHREKPEMVHSITPKAGLLSMVAAWVCRVPVRLHTFTGLVFPTATGITQCILILTDRITCSCATHITPEGQGVRNDLISYHITRKPLRVLGHGNIRGLDMNEFDRTPAVLAEAEKIRRNDLFTFVFVGRLVRDKGINELVEAFERLNRDFPATRLILVGHQEPELDPLEPETLAKIEHNKNIEAVGLQSDVRPWLAASDAFVFPSYREGFPNVVIEAGAMGLPSIVTDINGSREIIIEGKNGTIIPPRDTDALFDAMRCWVGNPAAIVPMAAAARSLITSRFSRPYVYSCQRQFYKELLKNRS